MKTKLTYVLFSLIIAFGCKKKKEEPTNTTSEYKDIVKTSCLLTKENLLVDDTLMGSTEYLYDSYGRLLKRQSLNKEGVFSDSGTYVHYTYEGNKLISIKENNISTQKGKSGSEPSIYTPGYPYFLTKFSYQNDTIISSISTYFKNENEPASGLKKRYYYKNGNLNSLVTENTETIAECKSGTIDSTVFAEYLNGRPRTQITYIAIYVCPRSETVSLIKNSEYRFSYDANMNLTKVELAKGRSEWSFWVQNEYTYDLTIPNLNNEDYTFSNNPNLFSKDLDRNLRISEKEYSFSSCISSDPQNPYLVYFRSDSIKVKNKNGLPELIETGIFSSYCERFQNYKTQKTFEYSCK